jgi:hypothetical protein
LLRHVACFDRPSGLFHTVARAGRRAGGYAAASAVAVLLAAVLPVARAEAVLAGMQWSFVVYVVAAIWAFSPVSLARVWGVLATVALLVLVSWVCARAGTGG